MMSLKQIELLAQEFKNEMLKNWHEVAPQQSAIGDVRVTFGSRVNEGLTILQSTIYFP